MKKIKILHILEATIGGTRTHLNQLISHLDQNKFEIQVIVSTRRTPGFRRDIDMMKKIGVKVHVVDMVRKIKPLKDLLDLIKIYRIIKAEQFDIVHAHSSKAGVLGRLAAYLAGIKIIFYTPHAFAFMGYSNRISHFFCRSIEKMLARLTMRIICVSESEKKIAIRNVCEKNKIIVIGNGVEPAFFSPQEKQIDVLKHQLGIKNKKIIGTVGDFRPQKNYDLFLKIAFEVTQVCQDITFLIIGDGERRLQIEKKITEYALGKNIILLGRIDQVHQYYSIMDIFLLTSLWEGMPYSVLEAMAMGIPVVATNVPGLRDVVVDNITGYLVPPDKPGEIVLKVIHLLHDTQKRQKFGLNGKEHIFKFFQIEAQVVKLEELYEHVYFVNN